MATHSTHLHNRRGCATALLAFLRTSRRNSGDTTGQTILVRLDAIRTVTLPWRCDARFNPDAAEYPMPYSIAFDGAMGVEQAFASADDLRSIGFPGPWVSRRDRERRT